MLSWSDRSGRFADGGAYVVTVAIVVSFAAYWQMITVNVVNQSWQVWHAIRAGKGSPTNPMVGVGRVLVACTVMGGLYLFRIDSVLVALLLFLFYIPDDVFAERVLGMG